MIFNLAPPFDYIRFHFIYTNSKNKKLNKGRFVQNDYINPFKTIQRANFTIYKSDTYEHSTTIVRNYFDKISKIMSRFNFTLS